MKERSTRQGGRHSHHDSHTDVRSAARAGRRCIASMCILRIVRPPLHSYGTPRHFGFCHCAALLLRRLVCPCTCTCRVLVYLCRGARLHATMHATRDIHVKIKYDILLNFTLTQSQTTSRTASEHRGCAVGDMRHGFVACSINIIGWASRFRFVGCHQSDVLKEKLCGGEL